MPKFYTELIQKCAGYILLATANVARREINTKINTKTNNITKNK